MQTSETLSGIFSVMRYRWFFVSVSVSAVLTGVRIAHSGGAFYSQGVA